MGERVSRLFQRTTVPEDTVSTDSGDYTTASDEDTASDSNEESCADSVDSGGTDYATADENRASDSSPGTSEGNVLLATEHSSSISPGIATTSTTPSHQPPSLSSSQAQETQHRPPSQELQAPSLLFSQEHPPSIPPSQAQEVQSPDQQFQASQPPSSILLTQAQEVQFPDQQFQASQPPSSIPLSQAQEVQFPDQQFQASQPPSSIPLSQAQEVQSPDQQLQASSLSASQAHSLSSHQPFSSIPSFQVQSQGSHQYIPFPQAQGAQLYSHKSLSIPSSQTQPSLSSGAGTRGDSLESKALCKLSDELVNAISASDPLISWKLLARDLIGPETVNYCQSEATQTKKSSKIVCAVIETVSASPHLFESLLSVLSESGNTALMSVGEKLKQIYDECKHQAQASLLVPQVQPQGSHQPLPTIPSLQVQEAQLLSPQTALLSQTPRSSSEQSISAGPPGDSPEVTALCQHSAELVKAISASDLLDLAWKLLAKRLIELDITKYCQLPAVISDEKSSKIVCAVIETVSASPHLFESLVSVLSESGNTALMSVGEKLKQTYELILKEKVADSSKAHEVQLPPPPSQPQSPELCLYAKYLRAVYTRSKLPVYSKWPPSPGKRFINLAIISKEGITREEADEFTKATLHGDLEEILKIKVPVKLKEILQANPDKELKCVLIEGAPGVGKTTLSWEVCHRWGKGELYQEYSIVVLLRLRDQNVQRAKRVADLFYYPDEETQKQIAKDAVNSQGSGILIILEGLDELPSHLISESSIFARLLSGTELPHATILVTSRPSATYKLWENWKEHISRHIEILGFTDDNITEYTQSILPVDEQSKFEDYLSLYPYIRSMLYIPLHCAITAMIYLQCQQSSRPPPKTLTELYTYLTQAILIRYLNNHPEYKENKITLDTFSNLPSPVYTHFLSLCELAFDGINKQKQVFHSPPHPFEHFGFMDAVSELFVHQQSASYSYNFLHLSVQEYLAAYHVSLMSYHEQENLLQAVDYYDHRSNMVKFLAGITKFKDLNEAVVKKVTGIVSMLSTYALELLYECQDVSILGSGNKPYTVYISTDSLHTLHSLGYCIANSRSKWELRFKHKSNIGADIICHSLKKTLFSDSFIDSIVFESCSPEFTYQFLVLLPKYMIPHIQSLTIISAESDIQSLPPQLVPRMERLKTLSAESDTQSLPPQLVPRMERLKTFTLETVIDTSHTELILALSRITTLRNLTLYKLNLEGIAQLCQWLPTRQLKTLKIYMTDQSKINVIEVDTLLAKLMSTLSRVPTLRNLSLPKLNLESMALLSQWLPTCQLETLTLHENTKAQKMDIFFHDDSTQTIECQYCTTEFSDQLLSQIPTASVQTLSLLIDSKISDLQPLPHCLPKLIPRMERLDSLTLNNVLDTSLTEIIPVLSRVPTLRNLTLHKLNSEGIVLLCQWLPTCQLNRLALYENVQAISALDFNIEINFCNNSIEAVNCHCCTVEFTDHILQQMLQQSATHIRTFTVDNEFNHPQPLPPCLPELIPKMERLNSLALKSVLDTSLTKLIPVLSRVPTLRDLMLSKLNSEGIVFLHQWLPTCQLERLTVHDKMVDHTMEITFHNNFIETIQCQNCTTELINQILLQIPQQSITHVKTFTMNNSRPQPLPYCLLELIPKMERLNTLTLKNVLATSLTKLVPVLSRVPALRDLTLPKLNSQGIVFLHQWLPTCQLERLTVHDKMVDHTMEITFYNNFIETIQCQNCTTELIDQILLQISPQSITHVKAFTMNKIGQSQPLPSCLPEMIPRMEKLNTLTLENVLDTSLTELIPVLSRVSTLRELILPVAGLDSEGMALLCQWLTTCQLKKLKIYGSKISKVDTLLMKLLSALFRVPTLRNLSLPELNSEGITLLCQWLTTCQLETLTLQESYNNGIITITFCNNSMEIIECQNYTLINQILSQQSMANFGTLAIYNASYSPQLLPPCLPELIPTMERLNTLTLENVLPASLTKLIAVLPRVPALRNLTLPKLNSEGIALLCQWLPTCQLETLTLHESYNNGITTTFNSNSMETIECQNCTTKFINQILSQQSMANVGTLAIYNANYCQLLPPCLPELIPRMERLNTLTLKNVLPASLTKLIPVLPRVSALRNLTLHKLNSEGIALLCKWLPTCQLDKFTLHETTKGQKIIILFCNNSIEAIDCHCCTTEFINQTLSQLPQQIQIHVKTLKVCSELKSPQPLPPCLSELLPTMERLNTLILIETLASSVAEIIPVLSRVPTLRNLKLHELNSEGIALLCQWQSALQLEELHLLDSKLYEIDGKKYYHFIVLRSGRSKDICGSSFETVECYSCTEEFIIHVQLQQLALHAKSMRIEYHSIQPLPPCLIQLIPRMERLNTLILMNVLDTSLTELIPALSRVPTLRNLTLHKLNSESITFLCQWLPTCQLEKLILCEQTETLLPKKVIINFCNNLCDVIECQNCTTNFINQILSQFPQQCTTLVKTLTVYNDHCQLLPPCLPELIPRIERLDILTLKNVFNNSLIDLLPALSRISILKNLRIQSDSGNLQVLFHEDSFLLTVSGTQKLIGMFLPQQPQQTIALIRSLTVTCVYSQEGPQPLPSCLPGLIPRMERLDTLTLENVLDTSLTELIPVLSRVPTLRNLTLHKLNSAFLLPTCQLETLTLHQHTEGMVIPRITITFCNNSIEAIEWHHCTTELIDQFLSQIPQQSTIHNIKTLKICNDQPQQLPALIQGMEQLNTLHCLHKLNSEGITHLCQWLPTCQLETLTLHSLSPDHSVMVSKALTSVSSLKTLDIRDSEFMTFLSIQALVPLLQQNQSLTELALTYCNIDSDGAHCLAKALHHNTTLKRLVMLGNPVGERGALTMAEMFDNNSTLEELSFIGANISNDSACCLVEALHHNTTLRKLDMRGNSVGERGACAIAEMLKHNTTLKELCLSHTEISRDGSVTMAEALHHNTTLRKLDMRGNSVGERGACAMAEMLKHNTTLEELDLRDSLYFSDNRKIGNNGIKAAVESLVRNKNLKKLIISSRYRDCVESLPVYQDVKEQVELC